MAVATIDLSDALALCSRKIFRHGNKSCAELRCNEVEVADE